MSVKVAFTNAWKTQCRQRIKKCDGIVVIVSNNTYDAEGLHWEVKCAKQEGIPIMAMYAKNEKMKVRLPDELKETEIKNWSWENIKTFVAGL